MRIVPLLGGVFALLAVVGVLAQQPAPSASPSQVAPASAQPEATPASAVAPPADAAPATTAPSSAEPGTAGVTGADASATAAPSAAPAETVADTGPAKPGDAAAGETKAAVCGACHGMDGNSADPQYPKLAGQNELYIARHLQLYKSGERQNPIMAGFAAPLSAQDMRDLGAFYAAKAAMPGTGDEALKARGEMLYRGGNRDSGTPACMACHGPSGRGNPGAAYPSLGGQHADYVKAQLIAFRDGTVYGTDDNANAIMAGVASYLSDEDIEALSSYIEGLHGVQASAAGAGTKP